MSVHAHMFVFYMKKFQSSMPWTNICILLYIKNCELYSWNSSYKSFEKKQPTKSKNYLYQIYELNVKKWPLHNKNDIYNNNTQLENQTSSARAASVFHVYFDKTSNHQSMKVTYDIHMQCERVINYTWS